MKCKLNESPVITTNSFNMNSITLDLNIPNNFDFHDYKITNIDDIKIKENNKFISDIGLTHDKYLSINIDKNNYQSEELNKIEYFFKQEDNLIDSINISANNKSNINLLINYESTDNLENFHNGTINISADDNSTVNLTIINRLNKFSTNIIDINTTSKNESNIIINLIDIGGNKRVYRNHSITSEKANNEINTIYIGKNKDIIDICFNYINDEIESVNNIEVEGLLYDNARKHFKGIIDFKSGAKKSVGKENENCLLLSNDAISRSLPILLCGEEDVDGAHSVSSGMIDKDKLFYLQSRGISETDAKKLIIKANFQKVLSKVPESIKDMLNELIDGEII